MATTPVNPPGTEPPFDDRPLTPRMGGRSDGASWIALVLGALVVLGLIFWFAGRPQTWTTASNTGAKTEQVSPPAAQPAPQPPAAQPPSTNP